MNRGLIIAVATICGAAAFLWSLVARSPRREAPVQPGTAHVGPPGAMRMPGPQTLAELEDQARSGAADFLVWFELAERRRAAGNKAGETEAWRQVALDAERTTQRAPERPRAWFALGWASAKLGDHEAERRAYEKAEPLYTKAMSELRVNITLLTRLGYVRRGLGNEAGAREAWTLGAETLDKSAPDSLDTEGFDNLACFRSLLGERERALDALTQAVGKGYWDADWAANDDDLAPIAHEEFFAILLYKMRQQRPQTWQDGVGFTPAH